MLKKVVFLGIVLLVLAIPTYAVNVKEVSTKCVWKPELLMDECETILEYSDINPIEQNALSMIKTDFVPYMRQKEGDKAITFQSYIETKPNTVVIKGFVPRGTQNYWGIEGIWNSSWWNSSYPYCIDLTIVHPQANYVLAYNMSYNGNMSYGNFSGIHFVNTACNNSGTELDFFMPPIEMVEDTWARFDILLDSNVTETISYYFGNDSDTEDHSDLEAVWENPIMYTTSDENTGTSLKDQSYINGYGNGTIDGAEWIFGRKFYSLNYSRANTDFTNFGDVNDITTGMTAEAWVYPMSYSGTNEYHVIAKWSSGSSGEYQLGLYGNGSALGNIKLSGGWCAGLRSTQTVPTEQWSLITLRWDGDSGFIYVNGELGDTMVCSGTVSANTDPLYQGAGLVTTHNFDGLIDEAKIWNYSLTNESILSHYSDYEPEGVEGGFYNYSGNETEYPDLEDAYMLNETWRRCLDNNTEQYHVAHWNSGAFAYYNDTYTFCPNECNDYNPDFIFGTLCNPDNLTQYVYLILIVLAIYLIYKKVLK